MDKTQANPTRVLLINSDAFELATLSASLRLHGVNIVGEASIYFSPKISSAHYNLRSY